MGMVRKMVFMKNDVRRKCETGMCTNFATLSVGREGAPRLYRTLLCDECMWEYAIKAVETYKDDKKFKLEVAEAFGNGDIAKGTPIYQLLDELKLLRTKCEAQEVELELNRQANAEFAEWREHKNQQNREGARRSRQKAKETKSEGDEDGEE